MMQLDTIESIPEEHRTSHQAIVVYVFGGVWKDAMGITMRGCRPKTDIDQNRSIWAAGCTMQTGETLHMCAWPPRAISGQRQSNVLLVGFGLTHASDDTSTVSLTILVRRNELVSMVLPGVECNASHESIARSSARLWLLPCEMPDTQSGVSQAAPPPKESDGGEAAAPSHEIYGNNLNRGFLRRRFENASKNGFLLKPHLANSKEEQSLIENESIFGLSCWCLQQEGAERGKAGNQSPNNEDVRESVSCAIVFMQLLSMKNVLGLMRNEVCRVSLAQEAVSPKGLPLFFCVTLYLGLSAEQFGAAPDTPAEDKAIREFVDLVDPDYQYTESRRRRCMPQVHLAVSRFIEELSTWELPEEQLRVVHNNLRRLAVSGRESVCAFTQKQKTFGDDMVDIEPSRSPQLGRAGSARPTSVNDLFDTASAQRVVRVMVKTVNTALEISERNMDGAPPMVSDKRNTSQWLLCLCMDTAYIVSIYCSSLSTLHHQNLYSLCTTCEQPIPPWCAARPLEPRCSICLKPMCLKCQQHILTAKARCNLALKSVTSECPVYQRGIICHNCAFVGSKG